MGFWLSLLHGFQGHVKRVAGVRLQKEHPMCKITLADPGVLPAIWLTPLVVHRGLSTDPGHVLLCDKSLMKAHGLEVPYNSKPSEPKRRARRSGAGRRSRFRLRGSPLETARPGRRSRFRLGRSPLEQPLPSTGSRAVKAPVLIADRQRRYISSLASRSSAWCTIRHSGISGNRGEPHSGRARCVRITCSSNCTSSGSTSPSSAATSRTRSRPRRSGPAIYPAPSAGALSTLSSNSTARPMSCRMAPPAPDRD